MHGLRRLGRAGTAYTKAQCNTVRERLLKIGACALITGRKLRLSLPEAYPHATTFEQIFNLLRTHPPWLTPG